MRALVAAGTFAGFQLLALTAHSAIIRGSVITDHVYVCTKSIQGKHREACLLYTSLSGGDIRETIGAGWSNEPVTHWRIQHQKLWLTTRGMAAYFTDKLYRIDFPDLLEGRRCGAPLALDQ